MEQLKTAMNELENPGPHGANLKQVLTCMSGTQSSTVGRLSTVQYSTVQYLCISVYPCVPTPVPLPHPRTTFRSTDRAIKQTKKIQNKIKKKGRDGEQSTFLFGDEYEEVGSADGP